MPSAACEPRPAVADGGGRRRDAPRAALSRAPRRASRRRGAEADFLRHAVDELDALAPQPGEEAALAERRAAMMQAEKVASDLREAHRGASPARARPMPALVGRVRRLERRARAGAGAGRAGRHGARRGARCARGGARRARGGAARRRVRPARARADRGAAVRAARRRPQIRCAGRRSRRPGASASRPISPRSTPARSGSRRSEQAAREAEAAYDAAAAALSASGAGGGASARQGGQAELAPLKLERARFTTQIETDAAAAARPASTGSNSGCRPIPARGPGR